MVLEIVYVQMSQVSLGIFGTSTYMDSPTDSKGIKFRAQAKTGVLYEHIFRHQICDSSKLDGLLLRRPLCMMQILIGEDVGSNAHRLATSASVVTNRNNRIQVSS